MRRTLPILFGFCAVTVSLYASQAPAASGAGQAAPPSPTGVVVGTVVDAGTGRPIPGAEVMVGAQPTLGTVQAGTPPPTPRRLIANANGRFVVTAVPTGPLMLSVTAPGYLPGGHGQRRPGGPTRALVMADGQREGPVTIRLWKPAAIEGRLVDEAGEPIVRASVRALRRMWNAGKATFVSSASTNTDDRGAFRLAGLVPGDWCVVVPATYDTTPASVHDEFMGATLRGGPAPQALTTAIRNSGGPTPGNAGERVGQFVVASSGPTNGISISDDARRVLVYPTLFYPALGQDGIEVVTLDSGQELGGVELQSIPTATVSVTGQLLGPDGPAARTGVRLVPMPLLRAEPETIFETARATTDVNGTFTFLGVPAGEYMVKASVIPRPALGGVTTVMTTGGGTTVTTMSAAPPETPSEPTLWATGQVSVGNRDIAALSLTLRPGLRVSGTIEFSGSAAPPAAVQWQRAAVSLRPLDAAQPPFISPGRFDGDGRFRTMGYSPGRYVIVATPPGPDWFLQSAMLAGRDVSLEPLTLEDADIADVVVTYSDRQTEVSGLVSAPVGGDPDGIVVAFPSDVRAWVQRGMNTRQTSSARVRSDGRYTIKGLPAGEYLLAGVPSDVDVQTGNVEFYEALTSQATRVVLAHGDQKSVDVRIVEAREAAWHDDDGQALGSGPFVPESQAAQMPPREQALPATGSGSISGVVTLDDDASTPLRRATVRLIGSSATSVSRLTSTDDQGRFVFRDLPVGRYNVVASRLGYVSGSHGQSRPGIGQSAPVALGENQHLSDVRVRVGRGAVIAGRIVDEFGQPVDSGRVSLMQFRTVNGERVLSAVVTGGLALAPTDDRGAYRLYGLPAGEYAIAVTTLDSGGELRRVTESEIEWADRSSGQPPPAQGPTVGVAPTYFPGTADPAGAVLVRVGPGEERTGIDFVTQFVRTAKLSGRIEMPDGTAPRMVQLSIVNESRAASPLFMGSLLARANPDGTFTSANLPPGKYTLLARAADSAAPAPARATAAGARPAQPAMTLWAIQEVILSGDDVSGVVVRLAPGMTISGRLRFDGATQAAPSSVTGYSVRVSSAANSGVSTGVPTATVNEDGTFQVAGVAPGPYRLSISIPRTGPLPTWTLRGIQHGDRDLADAAFDIQAGVDLADLDVVLTDRVTQVSGNVLDQQGRPVSDYSVILLPTDEQLWENGTRRRPPPQRPDTTGRFRAVGLPPGEYYLALVTEYEPDQLSDTAFLQSLIPAAIKITLAEGEHKVQDIKLAGG